MNAPLNNHIFSETGCINRDMMMKYRSGKMRHSDKYEVEKHLIDCNLCSEALEGLAMIGSLNGVDEVNQIGRAHV